MSYDPKEYLIGTADTIKEMLEQSGWTVTASHHEPDNPYCGSVTATKSVPSMPEGECLTMTYYFAYHTLAAIDEQFKRIAGEIDLYVPRDITYPLPHRRRN